MKESTGNTRTGISFVMLGSSLAALVLVYGATTLLEAWRERQQTPRLAIDSLVKALRTHHRQPGRFPADFRELEVRVWKHRTPPDFGADGRSLSAANYYYPYYRVDASTSTIWVVPTGPRRDEGATHFLLLTPNNLRRWKGAPLSLSEVTKVPPVPQYREMGILGVTEQQPIELSRKKM